MDNYESKILDHLGLVAGMCDELELAEQIDRHIAQDFEQRKVSVGQAVKAMILNGLGFVNQRLYLTELFFDSKPTERLLGEGVRPEHLNDDTLGRALDALYDYGVTELFRDLAAHAADKLNLAPRFAHLDATSFHVDGCYNSEDEEPEEGVIHVRKGYSRDHRPELNQVVLDLMVEHRAGLPILMAPLSGNTSDQGSFPKLIDQHLDELQMAYGFTYVVADSARYGKDHIRRLHNDRVKFITRVPETLNEAKQVIQEADLEAMQPLQEGYRAALHLSDYGEVPQRWLVVHSEAAEERARKSARKQLDREHEGEAKAFQSLAEREYACRADAEKALEAFEQNLKASVFKRKQVAECTPYTLAGIPAVGEASTVTYLLQGTLAPSAVREAELLQRKSLFIVATNELDEDVLSNEDLLEGYMGQSSVERGFRFLKDPLFLASSLFLKSEQRVMALLMVMTLCLLVYAALEWRIRERLRETEETFPDQKGKPTQRPTARWAFQNFVGIHLLNTGQQVLVLNMKEHHQLLVSVLGPRYERLYASGST